MRRFIIALAAGTLVAAGAAQAERPVNARQLNQERRIDAGTRSGKLTGREAASLKYEQQSIERLRVRLKARHGGRLTAADKRLIHQRQEAANRHILNQKHDRQRGPDKLKIG